MGSPLEGKVIESEVEILFSEFIQLVSLNCFPHSVDVVHIANTVILLHVTVTICVEIAQIDNTVKCNNNNFSDICSRDKSDVHIPYTGNYQPKVESHKTSPIILTKVIETSPPPLSEHNTLSIPITF